MKPLDVSIKNTEKPNHHDGKADYLELRFDGHRNSQQRLCVASIRQELSNGHWHSKSPKITMLPSGIPPLEPEGPTWGSSWGTVYLHEHHRKYVMCCNLTMATMSLGNSYNFMRPLWYMQYVINRNIVMQHMTIYILQALPLK